MNSNLKRKMHQRIKQTRIKLNSNQIKKPKLSKTALHGIDDNLRETWLDKTQLDSKIKMTQNTQYEPIRISIKYQINKKQNSNINLYGSYTKFAK